MSQDQLFPLTEAEKRGIIHRDLKKKVDTTLSAKMRAEDELAARRREHEQAAGLPEAFLDVFEKIVDPETGEVES